jgi:hypothetical protein
VEVPCRIDPYEKCLVVSLEREEQSEEQFHLLGVVGGIFGIFALVGIEQLLFDVQL